MTSLFGRCVAHAPTRVPAWRWVASWMLALVFVALLPLAAGANAPATKKKAAPHGGDSALDAATRARLVAQRVADAKAAARVKTQVRCEQDLLRPPTKGTTARKPATAPGRASTSTAAATTRTTTTASAPTTLTATATTAAVAPMTSTTGAFAALPTLNAVAAATPPRQNVAMRVLLVSAAGTEPALAAVKESLQFLGLPYDVWIASQRPGEWLPGALRQGTLGKYAAILLMDGQLAYTPDGGATWLSAFSAADWDTLHAYEAEFGAREVVWYTWPTAAYGFATAGTIGGGPCPATVTDAGRAIWPYVNAANAITLANTWIYSATLVPEATALLQDATGQVLAAYYPQAGRETIALTFDSSRWTRHHKVLAYGLLNWATKGLFLGQRRIYAQAQSDDAYIDDDVYGGGVYRMTGDDVTASVNWMHQWQAAAQFAAIRVGLAFNGLGANGYGYNPDTLTPAFRTHQAEFEWINHTYDHTLLNGVTYDFALAELVDNHAIALREGFTNYAQCNLVTPEISGLTTAAVMRAAKDFGIRFVVSDTSRPEGMNPSPNAGIANALEPSILEIPRYPTNIFYNTTTPAEQTAFYNQIYGAFWGRNLTYTEIVDFESNLLVDHMLLGDTNPWMFHVANMRAYDGVHSILSDVLDAVFTKFQNAVTLPVLTPPMQVVGETVAARMAYNAAAINSWRVGNDFLVLIADRAVTVPVTGLNHTSSIQYGGQPIAFVALAANQPTVLPLGSAASALTLALANGGVAENGGVAAGQLTITRDVADLSLPLSVALASSDAQLVVPATVEIPAGSASVTVAVTTVDDALANGDHWVLVTADGGDVGAAVTVVVLDDDEGRSQSVAVAPAYVAENGGAVQANGVVTLSQPAWHDVAVSFASANAARVPAPATVLVPAGQTSATFTVGAANDDLTNGDELIALTATAGAYGAAAAAVTVEDDEGRLLALAITPAYVLESAGPAAATGTVTLNVASARDQVVALGNGDAARLVLPAAVTIPAGQLSATFTIDPLNNAVVDGDALVAISVQSPPYTAASAALLVEDEDARVLTLALAPAWVREGAGPAAGLGTLTIDRPLTHAQDVALSGAAGTRLEVPATVTLAAGETSTVFAIGALDNADVDHDQVVTLLAQSAGYPAAAAALLVEDDDGRVLTVAVTPATVAESAGTAAGTVTIERPLSHDQLVALSGAVGSRLSIPESVTVVAGAVSASFAVGVTDNAIVDGDQTVALLAESVGYPAAGATVLVTDDDRGILTLSVAPRVLREEDGPAAAVGTVGAVLPFADDLVINLTSADPARLLLPASVILPAGATSVTIVVGTAENAAVDAVEPLAVSVTASGCTGAAAAIYVRDNDTGNQLANGDAEEGDAAPAGWTTYGATTGSWDAAVARSGFHALAATGTGGAGGWTGTSTALAEPWPNTLTFAGWVRTQGVASTATVGLSFALTYEDGTTSTFSTGLQAAKGTHDWQLVSRTETFAKRVWRVTPTATLSGGAGSQLAWFDDVSVVAHPTITWNYSAEDGSSTTPNYWWTSGQTLSASTGWVTDAVHSGARALKVVNNRATNALWYGQQVSLAQPGPMNLTFRGWSKALNVAANANYGLQFYVTFEDNSTQWVATGLRFTAGTHEWEERAITTSFAKRVKSVRPYALLYGGSGTQTVWWDDIEAVIEGSVVSNFRMENGTTAPEQWSTGGQTLTNSTGWATDQVHAGQRALKIANSAGTNAYWTGQRKDFTGTLPQSFTLRGWTKAENVSATASTFAIGFYAVLYNGATTWALLDAPRGSTEWQRLERTVVFNQRVKSLTPYCLLYGGSGAQVAWFDDVEAVPSAGVTYNPTAEVATAAGTPEGWTTSGQTLTTTTGWATDAARSGSHALKIAKAPGANASWAGTALTFAGTQPYTLAITGWSKADAVVSPSRYSLGLYVVFSDNTSTWYYTGMAFANGTHDWARVQRTVKFSKRVQLVQPYALFQGGSGTVWFDDVQVVPTY